MEQEMHIGYLFEQSFKALKKVFPKYLWISLAWTALITVFFAATSYLIFNFEQINKTIAIICSIAGITLFIITSITLGNWTLLRVHSLIYAPERNGMEDWNEAINKLPTTFGTSILESILVLLLTICLIIPGIVYTVYWTFSILSVLFNKKTFFQALKDSRAIIKGRWWRLVGYNLAISLCVSLSYYAINFIVGIIFGLFSAFYNFTIFEDSGVLPNEIYIWIVLFAVITYFIMFTLQSLVIISQIILFKNWNLHRQSASLTTPTA